MVAIAPDGARIAAETLDRNADGSLAAWVKEAERDEAEGEHCNQMIANTSERPWQMWKKKVGMG